MRRMLDALRIGVAWPFARDRCGSRARTRPSSSSCRIGCRRRIRLQKAIEDWGADVEKASGGTIKYKVFPVAAARQGVRSLRHGARRHRRCHLCQPRLSARPLPDHRRGRICRSWSANANGGIRALDSWYRKYAANEMKDVKFCFSFILDPRTLHSKNQKDRGARRHQRHEDPAGARDYGRLGDVSSAAPTCRPAPPEVRDVHRKGVAEAVTFPWGSILLFGIDKVTKYHMDAPLYTTMFHVGDEPKRSTPRCRRRSRR